MILGEFKGELSFKAEEDPRPRRHKTVVSKRIDASLKSQEKGWKVVGISSKTEIYTWIIQVSDSNVLNGSPLWNGMEIYIHISVVSRGKNLVRN